MRKHVTRQVVHVWIALLGILFSALAPTISHAMALAAQGGEEVPVCTAEGMKMIALAKGPSKESGAADHTFKHCTYCPTHGNTGFVPPTAPFVFSLSGMHSSHPPLFYQSAKPLFSWTAAQPRGPPILI